MTSIDTNIAEAERITGYNFTNKTLCATAIQMASPQKFVYFNGGRGIVENNRRLCTLGESVLAHVFTQRWYSKGAHYLPKEWDAARQEILSTVGLDEHGRAVGMEKIVLSESSISPKMLAQTFKALMGAIYQDGGENAVLAAVTYLGLDDHPALKDVPSETAACREAS